MRIDLAFLGCLAAFTIIACKALEVKPSSKAEENPKPNPTLKST